MSKSPPCNWCLKDSIKKKLAKRMIWGPMTVFACKDHLQNLSKFGRC